jgi:hypothetical protein
MATEFQRTLRPTEPQRLYSQGAGGLVAHQKRIAKVLAVLGADDEFDPAYLAQLRYDKSAEDGFDGICNQAIHLFTAHASIKTEPLNVNFIFSGWNEKLTQWSYLYSRLPYVLFYARLLVEHVCAEFEQTDPIYVADIDRRISAATLLWWPTVADAYPAEAIDRFVEATGVRLFAACLAEERRMPTITDLTRMARSGAWPGEPTQDVRARQKRYSELARSGRHEYRQRRRSRGTVKKPRPRP